MGKRREHAATTILRLYEGLTDEGKAIVLDQLRAKAKVTSNGSKSPSPAPRAGKRLSSAKGVASIPAASSGEKVGSATNATNAAGGSE